jgi:hypothetical protein
MKKIYLLFFFFVLINNSSKGQSLEETVNFIELKLEEMRFENDVIPKFKPYLKTMINEFEIKNNFLIAKKTMRDYTYGNLIDESYILIYIPNIISANFELNVYNDGSSGRYFKIKTKDLSFYSFIRKESKYDVYNFINNFNPLKINLSNEHLLEITDYDFEYKKVNPNTEEKIKKAFKHLVGLKGGKILDDLF